MKLLLSRLEFLNLITKFQTIIPLKPTTPALANILIEAKDDQLIITASDLNLSLQAHMPAKILEEGAIALPGRKILQLARELTVPHFEIDTPAPEKAIINAGSSHFKIQGIHKSEFPEISPLSEFPIRLPTAPFKQLLKRSSFAAARHNDRPSINGINLTFSSLGVTAVATDGQRLVKLHLNHPLSLPEFGSYILPLKTAEELFSLLDEREKEVEIMLSSRKLSVECGNLLLISNLLMGPYPDVLRTLPQKSQRPLSLHREELSALLKQVSLFTSEHSQSVRFSFTPGLLHLSATSGEIGEGKVSMALNYSGPKMEIAFNPRHFLDILHHTEDEVLQFDVTDSYNPGLISDSSEARFMLMPLRLEALH
jgi:DNA polymerase III subunit beta